MENKNFLSAYYRTAGTFTTAAPEIVQFNNTPRQNFTAYKIIYDIIVYNSSGIVNTWIASCHLLMNVLSTNPSNNNIAGFSNNQTYPYCNASAYNVGVMYGPLYYYVNNIVNFRATFLGGYNIGDNYIVMVQIIYVNE